MSRWSSLEWPLSGFLIRWKNSFTRERWIPDVQASISSGFLLISHSFLRDPRFPCIGVALKQSATWTSQPWLYRLKSKAEKDSCTAGVVEACMTHQGSTASWPQSWPTGLFWGDSRDGHCWFLIWHLNVSSESLPLPRKLMQLMFQFSP